MMILRRVRHQHEVTVQAFRHRQTVREILQKPKKTNKDRKIVPASGNWLRDLQEWAQEFTDNLEDEGVLQSRDTPTNTSQGSDSERTTKVVSGKHSIFAHFPRDRNCEVCKRTKIKKAPCRKRTCDAVLRAENLGGLVTADHKVVIEGCQSRKNHRHAVEVQTRATSRGELRKSPDDDHRVSVVSIWNQVSFGVLFSVGPEQDLKRLPWVSPR